MMRKALVLAFAFALASCGGGGTTSAIPKTTPTTPQAVTFSFKLTGKATMARLHRPAYVSIATQGIAIDWASTDLTHPDFAAAVSATCPSPLPASILACTVDAQGDTDYTFALTLAPGTYTIAAAAFDKPPSGGAFAGLTPLARGQLAAPFTVTPGTTNVIPSMTFYGIPASVSLVPAPAQNHVIPFGAGWAVIGAGPQTFFAQALDADGFAIASSDPGAPTLSVSESASDAAQYFSIASTSNKYAFTLTAKQAPAPTVSAANIIATATAGGGLPEVATSHIALEPIEELWVTQAAGGWSTAYGLTGFALMPPTYTPPGKYLAAIDFVYDTPGTLCGGAQCQFEAAGANASFAVALGVTPSSHLYELPFSNTTGSYTYPSAPLPFTSTSISNVAVDAAGHVFVSDNGIGALFALSTPTDTSYSEATGAGLAGASALAVAPSIASIPVALQQTIWVGAGKAGKGNILAYAPFTGTLTPLSVTVSGNAPALPISTIGFDTSGKLWVLSGGLIYIYTVSGTSPITLTLDTSFATNPYNTANSEAGSSFGASVGGIMWIGSFGSYNHANRLIISGCPACTIGESYSYLNAPVDASFVMP